MMERGVVRSFLMERGFGAIACQSGADLEFYANDIVSGDRTNLKQGDEVYYEVQIVRKRRSAINISKCNSSQSPRL